MNVKASVVFNSWLEMANVSVKGRACTFIKTTSLSASYNNAKAVRKLFCVFFDRSAVGGTLGSIAALV